MTVLSPCMDKIVTSSSSAKNLQDKTKKPQL